MHRQGDLFGDGVNLAARIAPLAEPEGVCLSAQVYDHVWNKVELPLVSMGKRSLKNVRVPVEVFRVVFPWSQPHPEGPPAGGPGSRSCPSPTSAPTPGTGFSPTG